MPEKREVNDWREVYEFPLTYDGIIYAWCANKTMALTFVQMDESERKECVDAINGKGDFTIKNLAFIGPDFYVGDFWLFSVRGWGYLTGINGLNLSEERANEIQGAFIQFVFDRLKG
jgi:hypothetical protein